MRPRPVSEAIARRRARAAECARLRQEALEANLLTTDEAALVLGIHPEALRRRLRRGELGARRLDGGPRLGWRIPREAVLREARAKEVLP